MPLETACPCLLSWVLRVAEMPPFFRPEQGKHEETRRELVTLLKKKKKEVGGGEGGESPIICCQVFTDLDIFFKHNFTFNNDREVP